VAYDSIDDAVSILTNPSNLSLCPSSGDLFPLLFLELTGAPKNARYT
jgi:hypothetical protein